MAFVVLVKVLSGLWMSVFVGTEKTLFSCFILVFFVNCCVEYGWALGLVKVLNFSVVYVKLMTYCLVTVYYISQVCKFYFSISLSLDDFLN